MLFTLEALEAKHGDCLILHYGPADAPRFILIDGGPSGVYKTRLGPRLAALKGRWHPEQALPLRMLMVSHIDDDHIQGVLDLTSMLVECREDGRPLPYQIRAVWHNGFDDILGNKDDELFASLSASVRPAAAGGTLPPDLALSRPAAMVVASIGQGRSLRDHVTRLGISLNPPSRGLVMAPGTGPKATSWGDGLRLTVLGPRQERIEALHREWEREIKKRGWASDAEGRALAASYTDNSVFNLSSLIVLAEMGDRRMLLPGDARGDDILAGLQSAKLLRSGTCHLDLLKLPHHGSNRNVETDFFRQVTADRYVISANGEYGNPEDETLQMISEARGKADFTLSLTNRDGKNDLGKRLRDFFAAEKSRGRKYRVVFRKATAPSLKVDLLDPVGY